MENTKIVIVNSRDIDEDCFIRLCNSPQQEMRRKKHLAKDRRNRWLKRVVKDVAIVAVTTAVLMVILNVL